MCPPLVSGYNVPAPQDLQPFWRKAERAVEGLGLDVSELGEVHIKNLGDHFLGETAMDVFRNKPIFDWAEFREMVEERFGLDDERRADTFFDLERGAKELEEAFILRVED